MTLKCIEELCIIKWGIIQKLKRTWLVILKLTRGISQILTGALESVKNLRFSWLLVTIEYIVWAKTVQRSYLFSIITEEICKFEEKLTCGLKKDLRNLANFHQSTWKFQNRDFDGILLSKVEKLWPQNLQRSYVSW